MRCPGPEGKTDDSWPLGTDALQIAEGRVQNEGGEVTGNRAEDGRRGKETPADSRQSTGNRSGQGLPAGSIPLRNPGTEAARRGREARERRTPRTQMSSMVRALAQATFPAVTSAAVRCRFSGGKRGVDSHGPEPRLS